MKDKSDICKLLNQLFEVERKLGNEGHSASRNIGRMKVVFEEWGFVYESPMGQIYADTRTDCDADISGDVNKPLKITQVIKPIIYQSEDGFSSIIQKAVVIVEND